MGLKICSHKPHVATAFLKPWLDVSAREITPATNQIYFSSELLKSILKLCIWKIQGFCFGSFYSLYWLYTFPLWLEWIAASAVVINPALCRPVWHIRLCQSYTPDGTWKWVDIYGKMVFRENTFISKTGYTFNSDFKRTLNKSVGKYYWVPTLCRTLWGLLFWRWVAWM